MAVPDWVSYRPVRKAELRSLGLLPGYLELHLLIRREGIYPIFGRISDSVGIPIETILDTHFFHDWENY